MASDQKNSHRSPFMFWIGFIFVFLLGGAMMSIGPSPGCVSILYVAAALGASLKRRNAENGN